MQTKNEKYLRDCEIPARVPGDEGSMFMEQNIQEVTWMGSRSWRNKRCSWNFSMFMLLKSCMGRSRCIRKVRENRKLKQHNTSHNFHGHSCHCSILIWLIIMMITKHGFKEWPGWSQYYFVCYISLFILLGQGYIWKLSFTNYLS